MAPGGIQHKRYEKERRSKARAASRRAARALSPSLELTGSSSGLFVLGSEGLISVLQPEGAVGSDHLQHHNGSASKEKT